MTEKRFNPEKAEVLYSEARRAMLPVEKVIKYLNLHQEADLVVCGAQGLNAFEHYVMGSVSQHIVRNSPCDVLVVRREKSEKIN